MNEFEKYLGGTVRNNSSIILRNTLRDTWQDVGGLCGLWSLNSATLSLFYGQQSPLSDQPGNQAEHKS